jgi:hypothetical protein
MMDRTGAGAADTDVARQHYKPSASRALRGGISALPWLLAAAALVVLRLPSLVQPMGADQALYAYVGERILDGGLPYVDAWDQKPPAIHYVYALLRLMWPADAAVAAADLAAAAGIAALLWTIGARLASRGVGAAAATLFLLLSNPAFTRLNGVRVRAQCETFIALAVTAAVFMLVRRARGSRTPVDVAAAGACLGLAFALKYNAAIYAGAAAAVLLVAGLLTWRRAAAFALGCAMVPVMFLAVFSGALGPLYAATIEYNMRYSGETYAGPLDFVRYLLTFPIAHARVDALWTLGGAGCAVLLAMAPRNRTLLIPVVWVAAACVSVAINGSRGLPQYFVQVAPALALAAAWAGGLGLDGARRLPPVVGRVAVALVLLVSAVAVWRVNQFPKLVEQTWFDARHLFGRTSRETYLARYVDDRKYSALAASQIARVLADNSQPGTPVYLFGFTAAAYVYADRPSASRFFWSRPVIAGFKQEDPGYGAAGLLADLQRARPAVVALQVHDWAPDVDDSAHFFLTTPPLAGWLRSHYRPADGPPEFDVWIRRD